MRWADKLRLRLRSIGRSSRVEHELDVELAFHLEQLVNENLASAMSPEDARFGALRNIGGIEQIKEQCRDTRRVGWIADFRQDVRYAVRTFRHAPGLMAVIVITLGLGIGANTAIFSIADALLLRSLPLRESERLIQVLQPDGPGLQEYGEHFAASDFPKMAESAGPFVQLAGETETRQITAAVEGVPEELLRRVVVSENYFDVLGVGAVIGRTISTKIGREAGRQPIAVISYGFWKRRFNLDPRVLGNMIRIGNSHFQVVGAAEPNFSGLEVGSSADIWTPLGMEPQPGISLRLIGRLNPGASPAQALGPLQALFHQRMLDMVGHAPPGTPDTLIDHIRHLTLKVIPAGKGMSSLRAEYGKSIQIVFGLVALVLLLACTTVATLLDARSSAREREMALRASLGASRWRLVRQLLTETVLIAAGAAGLGLVLAHWTSPLIVNSLAPSGSSVQLALRADGRLLVFTLLIGILVALFSGFIPAWRSSQRDLNSALKSGPRLAYAGGAHTGKIMVVSQVAMSLLLLLGAALFVRTLINLTTIDVGFDRRNVILANIQFRGSARQERLSLAWEELRRRLAAVPGIESASLSSGSVFNGAYGNGMLRLPGVPPDTKNPATCLFFRASAGFFRVMGMPLVKGRDFEPRDFDPAAPTVAVVSEALADHFFTTTNPIGRTFSHFEDTPPKWVTVIGVVKNTKFENLRNPSPMAVYLPYTWPQPPLVMSLAVRARRDVASLEGTLRRETSAANPDFSIRQIATQSKLIDATLVRERLLATVASFFGVLALLMAAVGLYGIMSFMVTRRTQEIGIRMALGASRHKVLRMVLYESGLIVTIGVVLGVALAQVAARLVSALLFGTTSQDPATIAIAVSILLAVALLAAFNPARRASKTDPLVALKGD